MRRVRQSSAPGSACHRYVPQRFLRSVMLDSNRAMTDGEEARGRTERRRDYEQRGGMENSGGLLRIQQRGVNHRRARRGYLLTVVRGSRKWTGDCSGPARPGYGRETRPTREAVRGMQGARETSETRF